MAWTVKLKMLALQDDRSYIKPCRSHLSEPHHIQVKKSAVLWVLWRSSEFQLFGILKPPNSKPMTSGLSFWEVHKWPRHLKDSRPAGSSRFYILDPEPQICCTAVFGSIGLRALSSLSGRGRRSAQARHPYFKKASHRPHLQCPEGGYGPRGGR